MNSKFDVLTFATNKSIVLHHVKHKIREKSFKNAQNSSFSLKTFVVYKTKKTAVVCFCNLSAKPKNAYQR